MEKGAIVDYAGLAESLAALSYPARLELLDVLKVPHALPDIRIAPHRRAAGENPQRVVSKQAVHQHLEKLMDAGLVETESIVASGHRVNKYTVNVQQFWYVSESLRRISTRFGGRGAVGDKTGTIVAGAQPADHRGPRLVLVHGVYEGRTYPLAGGGPGTKDGWTIGRARSADVALDYDPFVSLQHARITRAQDGYRVEDRSKNGTFVNWTQVERGEPHPLRPGDVLGIGHSLLCFARE